MVELRPDPTLVSIWSVDIDMGDFFLATRGSDPNHLTCTGPFTGRLVPCMVHNSL